MAGGRQLRTTYAAYVAVLAVLASAAGAPAAAPRLSVSLSPRPGTVQLGERWRGTVAIRENGRPFACAAPRLELRLGSDTVRVRSSRVRTGVFRAQVTPARVGRWKVGVVVGRTRLPAGTLTVAPGVTGVFDVAVSAEGSLLVGDAANYVLRARPGGKLTVIAGNGKPGSSGDGGRATAAAVGFPVEVAPDPRGGVTIVSDERRVRRVAPAGTISTLAVLEQPTAHAHDADGNLYASELDGSIRRVDVAGGAATTVAQGLDRPHGLAADTDGTLVVCETFANRLVRVDPGTRRVTPFATGLSQPVDVARAPDGTFVVADAGNDRIARVARNGSVTKLVDVRGPQSVAVDGAGRVYFTDRALTRVQRLDPASGAVTTVLGRR